MSTYSDKIERHYMLEDFENKLKRKSNCRLKLLRTDDDKRSRREVANNNERRRMQSINAGFENLRKLLPYCNDKEKISKATILQSTAKYISDLRMKINSLENDVIRLSNSDKISTPDKSLSNDSMEINEDSNPNKIKEEMDCPTPSCCNTVNSSFADDLGSSLSSSMAYNLSSVLVNLNSEDDITTHADSFTSTNESIVFSQQQQSNLEQLLAAVEQVERLEAMQSISLKTDSNYHHAVGKSDSPLDYSPHSSPSNCSLFDHTNFVVMKPTISPFAERIIQDAVNLQIPFNKLPTSSSIIESSSLILPISCPTYMTTASMPMPNERILNAESLNSS